MKKLILLIILFLGTKSFAQTKGITYQAVILNPSGEQLPGVNNLNSPMVDKNICLQFRFIDEFSNIEYQETVETKTDQFGMVNLVIGSGNQTAGYAASFETMEWNALKKSLIVGINTDGSCSSFTEISDQPFTAVPFAFSAINAGNVTGVVDIQNGGTNAVTVVGAKTNLGLENVDNTSDQDKPMSIAAQDGWNINSNATIGEAARAILAEKAIEVKMELDAATARDAELVLTNNWAAEVKSRTDADLLKEDLANKSTDVNSDGASDTKYPSVKSVKTYVDAISSISSTALADEVSRAKDAELVLRDDLAAEVTRARAAELVLRDDLATESSTARDAELVLTNNLATEATTARDAELVLTNNLVTESSTARAAELVLRDDLATEASALTAEALARMTADGLQNTAIGANASAIKVETSARTTAISAESLARTNGDATNAASILAETSARTDADGLQNTAIGANASAITAETSARTDEDVIQNTAIGANASAITAETSAITTAISAESLARANGDATNAASILAETSDRTDAGAIQNTAIGANASAITAETSARTTAISAESLARANGDATNAASIMAETSSRTDADAIQNTAIGANASAITAESLARTNGDATNAASILAETSSRTDADGLQNTAIGANASAITAETSARTTAISEESSARTDADAIQNTAIGANASAITAESLARTNGDATNAASILAETSARTSADGLQNTAISDNASAILTETSARTAAISAEALARTNGDDANAASILAETSARTTSDGLQNTAISDNASAITAETSARTTSDGVQNTAITDEAARAGLAEVANATAIGSKEDKINKSIDGTFASNSDVLFPTEKATKTYVDAKVITATTGNFVNLTTDQNVSGKKTFNDDLNVNGLTDLSFLRVNGFADIRDAIFTGSTFDVMSDAIFSGMRFDVMGDAMFGGNINNGGNITSNSFIKNNGLSTQFLKADGSVDSATYLTSAGTATNVSGVVAVANGGTGSSTVLGAKTTLGLENVDNTSDASKPVSTAGQTALNLKEDKINKSIDGTFASNSDVLFPTEKATKTYVDAKVITATTGNFVNLTTDQNVSGKKTFNDDLNVNGLTDLSFLRVNGFADIRDAIFTGSIFDVMSDARFSGMRFDVMGDAMFGGNINNGGNITSNSFIKNNGLSTQFLKADGSVDSATYLTSAGTATNVSGVVAIGNGGTGSSTVSGAKTTLGIENVDNTSDANKPVSAATQSALDLKADLASPTFTGTVTAPKLVIGANTYPTIDGNVNQVLTTDGSGTLNWTSQVTLADLTALQNQIANLNNAVVNLQSQISQLQNSGSWSPTVISGTMSDIFANYFVVNDVVYVSGNFSNADFDGMGMYVDLNIPVSANFINASDVHGTVLGEMLFGESASGYVEAIPNSSTVRLNLAGAHMMAFGTNGSFVFSYKLPGATASSSYTPVVTLGTGNFSDTNYIVNGNIVLVNGNFTNANLDDYGSYIDINLPISTNFVNSSDASGIISGISMNESLSGYIEGLVGTNKVRLRASGAHGMGFDTSGSFVFSYKINSANNTSTYDPTVLSGTGNFSSANYITVGKVVYVSGNFSNADFDGMGLSVDISIPGSTIFNNASDVHGAVAGVAMGESASGYVEAIPNSSTVRLNVAGAHQMAFGTNGSFIFSYIKQ